ncbi:thioredoxin family protein [candidate division WOR-3 bacterium]|nr:thioredoxin family protein [candidate division WOR-3 bacterium]
MTILDEATKKEVSKIFSGMKDPVTLVVFSRDDTIAIPGRECPTCKDNESLMKEVAALSDKITCTVFDHVKDVAKAEEYGIDKIPATLVLGFRDHGIRMYGVPAGHEFSTLLNAISVVSTQESGLAPETKKALLELTKPVHIQVFVTLSCPYCAPAVMLAHRMALENDHITADMINAQEFPVIAQRHNVYAVPKIVINGTIQFEGALDESSLLQKVMMTVTT